MSLVFWILLGVFFAIVGIAIAGPALTLCISSLVLVVCLAYDHFHPTPCENKPVVASSYQQEAPRDNETQLGLLNREVASQEAASNR